MDVVSSAAVLGTAALLDKLGLGASKKADFFISNTNLQRVRNNIISLMNQNHWGLIKEENIENHLVFTIQVGQWGLSVSGAQRLAIALTEKDGGVQGSATSKSVMGQLVDWGANQKNIDTLVNYLTHPEKIIMTNQQTTPRMKSFISPKFFVIVGIIFVLGIIGNLIVSEYLYRQRKTELNKVYEQIEKGGKSKTTLITINNTDVNTWQSVQWQSFSFSYPTGFTLTEGNFSEKYFYLDHEVPQTSNNIRIYGVSEDWDDKTINEVVESRNIGDKNGFPGYKLEEEGFLTSLVYYKKYTFNLDTTEYRIYRITKKYKDDYRILSISSEITNWNHNNEVFNEIIKSINY